MRIPTKPLKTFTGSFQNIHLDFAPEPPLTEEERSHYSANYPTTMAFLRVYLDGQDATELLPSGYLLLILDGLLRAYPNNPAARKATRAQAKCRNAM